MWPPALQPILINLFGSAIPSSIKCIVTPNTVLLKIAQKQYDSVTNYMKSLGVNKPIHIGETGWASVSSGFYGANGSKATDEYKQGQYHKLIRDWTTKSGISCFYFERMWNEVHEKVR